MHSTMPRPWTLNRIQKPLQPTNTAAAWAQAGQLTAPEPVRPYRPAVRCQAAAVPRAMASDVSTTCTMRNAPELVSPYMMSRMELVMSRPGTSSINAPMMAASGLSIHPRPAAV